MDTPAYKAKAMTPVDPMTASAGDRGRDGYEYCGIAVEMSARPCKPAAGSSPSASMMQSLYGGSKPA